MAGGEGATRGVTADAAATRGVARGEVATRGVTADAAATRVVARGEVTTRGEVATAAWLAGVHLGLLQAGYLLGLSRALSSAHLTYALVLTAWLAGATAGLWWAVRPRAALAVGLAAYVGVQAWLASVAFVAVSPWWFAPAVAAGGLWSGRFFAAAISARAAPGRVFARETDGFLLGTVAASVGYAWLGRHALVVLPALSGAWLLRRAGPALTLVLVVGCEDPQGRVPAPDPAVFRTTVYPALLRDCAFAGCHGDPRRPLFTPGPGRTRLDPTAAPLDAATAAELELAYDRARALLLLEGDEPPPLLHKPTAGAAHEGRDAAGRNVYEDPAAPGLAALTAWASAAEDE